MLTINLNAKSKTPLYEQIYTYIKEEIRNGILLAGTKLPSTRSLATHLDVSRNTIDMAYGQLLSEGYIEVSPKRGYFINEITTLISISSNEPPVIEFNSPSITYEYDFSPFAIDLNSFPYNIWRKLSKECMNDANKDLFLSGDAQGDDIFRKEIHAYLHESRGVNCSKDQIIVGAGADYLLQLLAQILPKKTIVAFENPTYMRAYKIMKGFGYDTISVQVDKNGINTKDLETSSAEIVYVTPSHQYPLGVVMPIKRRQELLQWSNKSENRYIIEDDHDSEFRYIGKPIPALQGMDSNDKVIYLGTFSRAIAPAIRIGYMVLPRKLLELYQDNFSYYASTVSRIDQSILGRFLSGGYFERHLNKMRKIYKSKHDTMVNALKIFHQHITIKGANAGLHVVVTFHLDIDETDLISLAREQKIKLYGLNSHYTDLPENYQTTILLGYANLEENKITEGIQELYSILKKEGFL